MSDIALHITRLENTSKRLASNTEHVTEFTFLAAE